LICTRPRKKHKSIQSKERKIGRGEGEDEERGRDGKHKSKARKESGASFIKCT